MYYILLSRLQLNYSEILYILMRCQNRKQKLSSFSKIKFKLDSKIKTI